MIIRLSFLFQGAFWGVNNINTWLSILFVELEGIEPSSKQGSHMLSTCLSLPKIFEHKQDQSHQLMPYPLKFRKSYEEKLKLFPILLCHFIKRFGTRAFEWHLVSTTLAEIKLIYYTSIKQREHNFRCQIKFW